MAGNFQPSTFPFKWDSHPSTLKPKLSNMELCYGRIYLLMLAMFSALLALQVVESENVGRNLLYHLPPVSQPVSGLDCRSRCEDRCMPSGTHVRCVYYCDMCCSKCQCVPPRGSRTKDECPCYRDWKNSKGGSKCP